MPDVKLAKNSKTIKFPHASGSVKATFRKAEQKALRQGWTKIVIIGESKDHGHWFHNRMKDNEAIGLLEHAKYLMFRDRYE